MPKLPPREKQILTVCLRERDLEVMSHALGVSIDTARSERNRVLRKLHVKSSTDLANAAIKSGRSRFRLTTKKEKENE